MSSRRELPGRSPRDVSGPTPVERPAGSEPLVIVYASTELAPLAGQGPTAEAARHLPRYLIRRGHRLRCYAPCWPAFGRVVRDHQLEASEIELRIGERQERVRFERVAIEGVEWTLVRHDSWFTRPGFGSGAAADLEDNAERYSLFACAVLEHSRRQLEAGSVVHANDWATALLAVYAARLPGAAPGVLSIRDLEHQGTFDLARYHELGLPRGERNAGLEIGGRGNLLSGGLCHADRIVLGGATRIREVLDEEHGEGLENSFGRSRERLRSVVDGIPLERWNPATDGQLKSLYSREDLVGKRSCKLDLQSELGLRCDALRPLYAVIGTLSQGRGTDRVLEAAPGLLELGVDLAVVGRGERAMELALKDLERTHSGRVGVRISADEFLERKALAGADAILLPWRSAAAAPEAIKAMRYGALPLAVRRGVLADTIVDGADDPEHATGFLFSDGSPAGLTAAVSRAEEIRRSKDARWLTLVLRAMGTTWSWERSAAGYEQVYREAVGRSGA